MRPSSNAPNDAELAAYIAGIVTSRRRAEIEHWIASDRANASHIDELRALLATELPSDSWNRARIWGNIEAAIEHTASIETTAPVKTSTSPDAKPKIGTSRRRLIITLASVAAALIVIVSGATYFVRSLPGTAEGQAPREYATRRGQRATVQLSDGSRVILAPDSRLRIADDFGRAGRSVELEGEAQFDVVHDSTRQFSVHAGAALIVDVGTHFDLRAYPTDSNARVAVSEGAVTIGRFTSTNARTRAAEGVLVRRGEVGQLDGSGHAHTATMDNAATYFAWTNDQLVFTRAPLREVLATIARWFDVDVHVADSTLAGRAVTAEFSTTSPAEMARALAQALNATAIDSGRTITLVPR